MNSTIIILIVVAVIIVLGIFAVIMLAARKPVSQSWKNDIRQRLFQLNQSINWQDPANLKLMIFELDKVLDQVLVSMRIPGSTLGERLKNGAKYFPSRDMYQQTWEIHKLRNTLAHEFNANFHTSQLTSAVQAFQRILQQLTA